MQGTVLVGQPVALPQQPDGAVVGRDDPSPPVQVDDTRPRYVQQSRERLSERPGLDQRMPDEEEMPHVGQKPFDHPGPIGAPTTRVDGIAERPHHARSTWPVETHVQAVLGTGES